MPKRPHSQTKKIASPTIHPTSSNSSPLPPNYPSTLPPSSPTPPPRSSTLPPTSPRPPPPRPISTQTPPHSCANWTIPPTSPPTREGAPILLPTPPSENAMRRSIWHPPYCCCCCCWIWTMPAWPWRVPRPRGRRGPPWPWRRVSRPAWHPPPSRDVRPPRCVPVRISLRYCRRRIPWPARAYGGVLPAWPVVELSWRMHRIGIVRR
mmetsp:Transcript_4654/g.9085  ORF Transcript_4654/g.9085 Transcript_4654/m.9085 type:complete len:207 (-) Transcript_4654:495-1115(-)